MKKLLAIASLALGLLGCGEESQPPACNTLETEVCATCATDSRDDCMTFASGGDGMVCDEIRSALEVLCAEDGWESVANGTAQDDQDSDPNSDGASCTGSSRSCSTQFSRFSCTDVDGCRWSDTLDSCTGISRSCDSYSGSLTCNMQPGCNWL